MAVAVPAASLVAAIVAAPLLAAAASPSAFALYGAFAWVCHQQPERSWHLSGFPLAVCVRCLGLYAGALGGAIARLHLRRVWLLACFAVLGAEWLAEWSGLTAPPSPVRFASGLAAGFFCTVAAQAQRKPIADINKL